MKVLAWMARLVIAAVLISGCSMYATWMTVQSYLDQVLAQYGIKRPAQKAQFSEFLTQMTTNLNIMNQSAVRNPGERVADKPGNTLSESDRHSEIQESNTAEKDPRAGKEGRDGGSKASGNDALPVWSQSGHQQNMQSQSQASESGESEQRKKVLMTTEQLMQTKDKLTADDKMKIFSLLVSKLPQKELQDISLLVEDGITDGELKQIEDILEKHLTPSELKELLAILGKY